MCAVGKVELKGMRIREKKSDAGLLVLLISFYFFKICIVVNKLYEYTHVFKKRLSIIEKYYTGRKQECHAMGRRARRPRSAPEQL